MRQKPAISVLMPVYNAGKTLKPAIWSVLNQGFQDFELLIYLDGCTDASSDIARSFGDSRIRLIAEAVNRGIVHARNALVREAAGSYVAWLDADDIMLPGRLAFQYEFMEVHPEILMLGSYVEVRNSNKVRKVQWPSDSDILAAWSFYRNPLVQSSLMLRRRADLQYDPGFEYLEDYRLLCDWVPKGKLAIYPEYLCSYYEDHEKHRIDKFLRYDFVGKLEQLMREQFARLDLNPGSNELSLIREFLRHHKKIKAGDGTKLFRFFRKAIQQNRQKNVYDKVAFQAVSAYQILRLAAYCPKLRLQVGWWFLLRPVYLFSAWKARVRYRS